MDRILMHSRKSSPEVPRTKINKLEAIVRDLYVQYLQGCFVYKPILDAFGP